MRSFLSKLWAAFVAALLALCVGHALAQTFKVNGDPAATGLARASATGMQMKATSATTGTFDITNIAAVWKQQPTNFASAVALDSEDEPGKTDWVLSYTADPKAFAGAKQCIVKRGATWSGQSLAALNLSAKDVVCAPITGPHGTYTLALDDGDYNILGVVPVIEFADGSRAWGSHPFGPSRGKNMKGQTITLFVVERDAAGKATAMMAATESAKAFFAKGHL